MDVEKLLRNVVAALRRVLDEHPDGCLEAALWHGVEACFVPRVIFDEAVNIMVYVGWARRAGGRLHAGSIAVRIRFASPPLAMVAEPSSATKGRIWRGSRARANVSASRSNESGPERVFGRPAECEAVPRGRYG